MAVPQSIAERFWSKVDRRGADECWPWTGCRNHGNDGRGQFYWSSSIRQITAPRASWAVTYGELPPRHLSVCHSCDNPACVNPAHLWLGDQRANMWDAVEKGRIVTPNQRGVESSLGRRTHCAHGHAFTPDNVRIKKTRDGHTLRICLTCNRRNQRRYEAKSRDEKRRARVRARAERDALMREFVASRNYEATGSCVPRAMSYEDAASRVRAHFDAHPESVRRMSVFADIIWPGHTMLRQGAALAASGIVRRLCTDGVLSQGDAALIPAPTGDGPQAATEAQAVCGCGHTAGQHYIVEMDGEPPACMVVGCACDAYRAARTPASGEGEGRK